MSPESKQDRQLKIAHVLFIDIVGYSKLLINRQSELLQQLNQVVRATEQFRRAEAADKLVRLPTGDGMALVFRTSPEEPAQCALELSKQLKSHPELRVRMGIHSGPVNEVADVNERMNVAGAGINIAQRVMDCGDAGHILLSKHVADDLEQYPQWREHLHELGQVEVKHGLKVDVVNFYNEEAGNAELPEKFKQAREQTARADRLASIRRRKRILIGAALFVVIASSIGLWSFFHSRPSQISTLAVSDKSIAVLPFENLSKDEENAFFAGGVQDEILSDLAKIADLKVISRTSVMKYKSGPERNLREIAKTLGVSHVVEGSVQRAGGRIRVSAQLIDARSDTHLWAEHYDRDFADIFAIQSEIAEKIADQLRSKLSPAERVAIAERPTADLVAYALYTKAKAIDSESNDWDWEKLSSRKVDLLEKATQRDPNFALAYCALANTQIDLSSLTQDPGLSRTHLELAKKAAEAALRVRPDLGEAHLELARYYYYAGIDTGDFDPVRDELAIARRTLPNDSDAIAIAARIDKRQNRWDDALANFRKASELDPRNDEIAYFLRLTLLEMRRYHELEQRFAKDAASDKEQNPWTRFRLADLKLAEGDPVAAEALLAQVPLDFSPVQVIWSVRFTAALYLHDYDAASRVIAATPAKFADNAFEGQPPESWADGQVARARGDKQKALAVFAGARKRLDATWETKFKNQTYFALGLLASFDAGLGRKEDAIREALRAVDLLPIAKDSYWGPPLVTNLALVYAWTGERDRAIEQLEIVAKVPNGPSYGDLKFNPCWDSLRGDPRFEKIVASLKPKD